MGLNWREKGRTAAGEEGVASFGERVGGRGEGFLFGVVAALPVNGPVQRKGRVPDAFDTVEALVAPSCGLRRRRQSGSRRGPPSGVTAAPHSHAEVLAAAYLHRVRVHGLRGELEIDRQGVAGERILRQAPGR